MRFRNDDQRKAMFANMFDGKKGKNTKVSSKSVTNFEVKTKKVKNNNHRRVRNQRHQHGRNQHQKDHECTPCGVNYSHHVQMSETKEGRVKLRKDVITYIGEKPRTKEEIGKRFDLNTRQVAFLVEGMIKKGQIEKRPFLHDLRTIYYTIPGSTPDPSVKSLRDQRKEKKDLSNLGKDLLGSMSLTQPKTVRQFTNEFGINTTVVQRKLTSLVNEGKVERLPLDKEGNTMHPFFHDNDVKHRYGFGYLLAEE